jgi:hypothetical protein
MSHPLESDPQIPEDTRHTMTTDDLPVSHTANAENVPPEPEAAVLTPSPVTKTVPCPECHELCGWCSWYRKNAREVGCGLRVPSGMGRPSKHRCDWGERAKGVPCGTCSGNGVVVATITYAKTVGRW